MFGGGGRKVSPSLSNQNGNRLRRFTTLCPPMHSEVKTLMHARCLGINGKNSPISSIIETKIYCSFKGMSGAVCRPKATTKERPRFVLAGLLRGPLRGVDIVKSCHLVMLLTQNNFRVSIKI